VGHDQRTEPRGVEGHGQVTLARRPPAVDRPEGLVGQRPGVPEVQVGEPMTFVIAEKLDVASPGVSDEPVREPHGAGRVGASVDEVAELHDEQARRHRADTGVAAQRDERGLQLRGMAADVADQCDAIE